MSINDYREKIIRKQILKKIRPKIKSSRSKHQKGLIEIDGKIEARVKIPNDHSKIMKTSRSKFIATDLRLTHEEFNNLIDCPLKGPKYFDLLKERLNIT